MRPDGTYSSSCWLLVTVTDRWGRVEMMRRIIVIIIAAAVVAAVHDYMR